MSLGQKFADELQSLDGVSHAPSATLSVSEDELTLEADVNAVDRMSCSLSELRLHLSASRVLAVDKLKQWAEILCKRVTYLLEQIGPLEIDTDAQQVLARSTPPQRDPGLIRFYEVLFQAPGTLRMARYEAQPGTPGRKQIEMQLTREVATKLANDLAQAVESL